MSRRLCQTGHLGNEASNSRGRTPAHPGSSCKARRTTPLNIDEKYAEKVELEENVFEALGGCHEAPIDSISPYQLSARRNAVLRREFMQAARSPAA